MRKKLVLSAVAVAAAVPLFAVMSNAASWFSHNSSMKSTDVTISYNSKLANGSILEAGNYTLEIPLASKSPELRFYKNGKLAASVVAQVKMENRKPSATEIDYTRKGNTEYITEIRPHGLKQAYFISPSSAKKSGV